MIQRFECLVGEINYMTDRQITMVSGGRKQQIRERTRRVTGLYRGNDTALGAFGIAHFDESAQPSLERCQVSGRVWQRPQREMRRIASSVLGHRREPMKQ